MSQKFKEDGTVVPVTLVQAGPCTVVRVKKQEDKDGYDSVQVGYGFKKKLDKALTGQLKDLEKFRFIKEFRTKEEGLERGKKITVEVFEPGDVVKVTGVSKGKGFQGVVKRHGFHGSPATHGHKDQLRMPGSIGATDAARVLKGTRMGGQMGNQQATIRNLEIVEVDKENNILAIKGAIPGHRNTLVMVYGEGELKFDQPVVESEVDESSAAGEEVSEVTNVTKVTEAEDKVENKKEEKVESVPEKPIEDKKEETKKPETPNS